jgi:hypothetical protein
MDMKRILVVARDDKPEALRMATGLTLLDDAVRVAVVGALDDADPAIAMQIEALDFADVTVERFDDSADGLAGLASAVADADAVVLA